MKDDDLEKFKQHYRWWGLTMNAMRPMLTRKEWDDACDWSQKVLTRLTPRRSLVQTDGEWDDRDIWGALK